MSRYVRRALATASLVPVVATVGLWIRSGRTADVVSRGYAYHSVTFTSAYGSLQIGGGDTGGPVWFDPWPWRHQPLPADSVKWPGYPDDAADPGMQWNAHLLGFATASTRGGSAPAIGWGDHTIYRAGWRVNVPDWAVVLVLLVPPLAMAGRHRRACRRDRAGRCRHCGYDVRATPERCPECGHAPPQSPPPHHARRTP